MDTSLELTFALKHLDQHLQANDANVKKIIKLQQRIISKDKQISCKGAVKIYQAYEGLLQDIEKNISTVDHILRFCNEEGEEQAAQVEQQVQQEQEDVVMVEAEGSCLSIGTLVAALTLTAEGSQEWILARVCGFSGGKYQIEDAEVEGEPEEKEMYFVEAGNVIPLPESDESALESPEFRLRQNVLALFPGTTCFYSAVVMSQPSRRRKTRDYLLKFADDDVPSRPCPPRFILMKKDE